MAGEDETLPLDGLLSYDPDGGPGDMAFTWTCAAQSAGGEEAACLDPGGGIVALDLAPACVP